VTALVPDVRSLSDIVWALLDGIAGVNAFDGEVTDPPLDTDGRVHAYAVYYPDPAHARSNRAGGTPNTLDWGCQVTCVGGDRTRALWCVDKVRAALTGRRVTIDGRRGVLAEVGNPGPIRRDTDVSPVRFYVPLEFHTSI
jgi:hypothetical protein